MIESRVIATAIISAHFTHGINQPLAQSLIRRIAQAIDNEREYLKPPTAQERWEQAVHLVASNLERKCAAIVRDCVQNNRDLNAVTDETTLMHDLAHVADVVRGLIEDKN